MIAASYARYSSDNQRAASIQDQERNNAGVAERHGLSIEHFYRDEAISGFDPTRSEYQRMLADAKAGQFQALVIDDLSRLGRDPVEREGAIRKLEFWRVRILTHDGYDSDAPMASRKMFRSGRNITDEMYLVDLAQKTHRGLKGQAIQGFNAGGRTYGYRHVPEYHPTRTDHLGRPLVLAVTREQDPEQAPVVRDIFRWYAEGKSPLWIARELNRRGIPSPRGKKWARTALYPDKRQGVGILSNPLYIGQYIWNRSQWEKNPENDNRRTRRERPADEWVTTEMPELRIVDQDTWNAVQRRIQANRNESISRALKGKNTGGRRPKYLFSGLLQCGCCGGNMAMVNGSKYGCSTHKERGPEACSNNALVRREVVESRLLSGIKKGLLTDEAAKLFRKEMSRMLAEARKEDPAEHAKKRLAKVEKEVENMVAAIAAGAYSPALQEKLTEAEAQKRRLKAEIAAAEQLADVVDLIPGAFARYREMVDDMERQAIEPAAAREALKEMLGEKIPLHPVEDGVLEARIPFGIQKGLRLASGAQPGVDFDGSGGRI